MQAVRGPQYGSFPVTALVMVLSITIPFGIAAAFGAVSVGAVAAAAVGMFLCAALVWRSARITVDSKGISWRFPGGGLSIPWSDIGAIEEHLLSGRVVRISSGAKVFFSMLDPYWRNRPVTMAIRHHLVNDPQRDA